VTKGSEVVLVAGNVGQHQCKQCETRAPLQYNEPLKSLTVSHLWRRVGMDISYMPKTDDGYHLLVVAREYCTGWAEAQPLTQGTPENVAYFFSQKYFVGSEPRNVW
jgi:hypothetical protein